MIKYAKFFDSAKAMSFKVNDKKTVKMLYQNMGKN